MMTSVGTNRARGSWEQTQTQSQTQHKQRPQVRAVSMETRWLVGGDLALLSGNKLPLCHKVLLTLGFPCLSPVGRCC